MTHVVEVSVLVLFMLAASTWIGGLVALVVVARVSSRVLSSADRIATFRGIGRWYGPIAGAALLTALGLGYVLSLGQPRTMAFGLTTVTAASLILVTVIGVVQARAMTRLRRAALGESAGSAARAKVHRGRTPSGRTSGHHRCADGGPCGAGLDHRGSVRYLGIGRAGSGTKVAVTARMQLL